MGKLFHTTNGEHARGYSASEHRILPVFLAANVCDGAIRGRKQATPDGELACQKCCERDQEEETHADKTPEELEIVSDELLTK
jgi:hypothetical protein